MIFKHEIGCVFAEDAEGNRIAEATFTTDNGAAIIDNTFVDPSLRGQGIAGKLMQATAEHIRSLGLKVQPVCSYAVKWFSEHSEYQDLL
ncbi:MAG: GNAT family N-acetyltransferase [Clostridiaceae bacterium]|nr:GNAT family N-acetyltransferase [Clostridiaceae bacterium]